MTVIRRSDGTTDAAGVNDAWELHLPGERWLAGKTQVPMRTTAIVTAAVAAACLCSSAFAETAEERHACVGDAFKMCSSAMPDRHEVFLCLQRNKRQLSQDCRVVMNRHPHEDTAKRVSARAEGDEAVASHQ